MEITNRHDFVTCLDRYPQRNGLNVYAHAKRHLLAAVDEVSFNDFHGPDYEVIGRLSQALHSRDTEAALWGMVFIDLWYCRNFGGQHWVELIARDLANVRFAIQAAYLVFAASGADGGSALAAILNRCRCWEVAERYVPQQVRERLRGWWQESVLPHRA